MNQKNVITVYYRDVVRVGMNPKIKKDEYISCIDWSFKFFLSGIKC
jgi:hypothetical protein